MPNIKSAEKRMRQNLKRRVANRMKKSAIRTTEKKLRKAVTEKNWQTAEQAFVEFSSQIDRAAKRNIYHKNTAARKKSRLAHMLSKSRQTEKA